MVGLVTKTLRRKIISLMVISSVVIVGVLLFFSVKYSSDALYNQAESAISEDLHTLTEALIHQEIVPKTNLLLSMMENTEAMKCMDALYNSRKANADTETITDTKAASSELDRLLGRRSQKIWFR